jgi:hypothetical protein
MPHGCDQCKVLSINGVACHETGCPKCHINPVTGRPYPRECKWCGCSFVPQNKTQVLCSNECTQSYYGYK